MASRYLDSMSSSSTLSDAFTTASSSATSASAASAGSSSASASVSVLASPSAAADPAQLQQQQQQQPPSSVTPLRKHRKMLKDGSSEVWPEYLERIFIQGLHAYWQSPWATYTKGRSRWRNQFLVDFLHNAGIERSKKQVASHIQVLRNMWKGQKEYDLVASAEEILHPTSPCLSASPGSPRAHKPDRTGKTPRARSRSNDAPESPLDVKEEPNEDVDPALLAVPEDHAFSTPGLRADDAVEDESMKLELISSPAPSGSMSPPGPLSPFSAFSPAETDASSPPASNFAMTDCHFTPSLLHHHHHHHHHAARGRSHSAAVPLATAAAPPCHLTAITLWAEGMQPVTFDVTALLAGIAPGLRPVLRIQLSASLLSDVSSPPTMHGFQGTATFSGRWQHSAACVTRVLVDGILDSEETGAFVAFPSASANTVPARPGPTALLPDSWLSRCRWRNAAVETRLTQQIFVDGVEVATILYDLQRPPTGVATAVLASYDIEAPRPRAASAERAAPSYHHHTTNPWSAGDVRPRPLPLGQTRAQALSYPPYGGAYTTFSTPSAAPAMPTIFS